jgi:hypothetical protein
VCRSAASRCSASLRAAAPSERGDCSSCRLPRPCRALSGVRTGDFAVPVSRFAPGRNAAGSPALVSVPLLFSACSGRGPATSDESGAVLQASLERPAGLPTPAGARSWRLYAFSEPVSSSATRPRPSSAGVHPYCLPGLFHPGDAHELPPSGRCTFQRSGARLRVPSSHAVGRGAQPVPRLRRVDPSGSGCLAGPFPADREIPALLAFPL